MARRGNPNIAQYASKGGKALVAKRGRQHMREIGKKGFQVTTEKYFDGDRKAHYEWLCRKGQFAADEDYRAQGFGVFRDPGPHPSEETQF